MKKQEKLQLLRKFKEKPLIDNVIIPLLEKMGFKNITVTHGSLEKGKDLLFYKENEFEEREYTGVQVKAVDIHGRAGEKGNATEILNQAQQSFTHEFHDTYDNKTKNIDRYIVMTSGNISEAARESIGGQLKAVGYYKTIQFFDGNKLVDLVDKRIPEFFWEEYNYFNRYFREMKKDFETIKDISAIGHRHSVNLEDIYVSLKLSEKLEKIDRNITEEINEKIYDEFSDEQQINCSKNKEEKDFKRERILAPDTAVEQFNRLVIIGGPGAGKTTLLKHLALKFCRENIKKQEHVKVPVPIILREFSESGKILRDYINIVFESYGFLEAKNSLEDDLKTGKCILLLDGFDELATRENQQKVAEDIHIFNNKYQQCTVLVTSRPAGYHDELSGFTHLEVMEFNDDQIKRFIGNWYGDSHHKKGQSMLKAIMENENIHALAKNPLMISIIAIICEKPKNLPEQRVDLYQLAVDVLLERWDEVKNLQNRFSIDQKKFILKKLAFRNHCENRRVVSKKEILKEIVKHSERLNLKRADINPILMEIWQRSYLLRQIALDTYDFLHLSFQEYFTALELKEQEDGIGTIIEHIAQPWWEEPIILYAGIYKDAGPLIKRIKTEVHEDIFYSNLMLFGKCVANAEFTDPSIKQEIARNLLKIYKNNEFRLLNEKATEVLRQMKEILSRMKEVPPQLKIHLFPILSSTLESEVQEHSAPNNGIITHEDNIDIPIEILLNDEDSSERILAADALGAIGSTKAIPALTKALTVDKDDCVRWSIVLALGTIGSVESIPVLTKMLINDKAPIVRRSAAEVIGTIGGSETIPALKEALCNDKDYTVRGKAAEALGVIGNADSIDVLIGAGIQDKESSVRRRAIEALGVIGGTAAITYLVKALTEDKESEVRVIAAFILGKIGDKNVIKPLKKALKYDGKWIGKKVKETAFEALYKISRRLGVRILPDDR
jgi:HEAT repeat protein